MSMFIVSQTHIDHLVRAAGRMNLQPTDPTTFGRSLWQANLEACFERYPDTRHDKSFPAPFSFHGQRTVTAYRYRVPPDEFDPLAALKAVHCYTYQVDDFLDDASPISRLMECLEEALIRAGANENDPRYDILPWRLNDH